MNNNLEIFMTEYAQQLKKAVETKPDFYHFPVSNVPVVVQRMREAIINKKYNKDGFAFKWTCKALNIRYTYTGINNFVGEKQ